MKRKIGFMLLIFIFISHYVWAELLPLMRISVENTESHVQTHAVKRFAEELQEAVKGKIEVRFYSNATLFRDKDVVKALIRGHVEMAVPGTWHLSKFEPNVGVFLLPTFYGRDRQVTYDILDSEIGKTINRKIETSIDVKIIGRWIDLGHAHLFSVEKRIDRHEDIRGMKIRVAGGIANKLRIDALDGNGIIIPWPDLPEYLDRGKVDAILTSYETVRSAQLWEHGISYAFEDKQYFPQYIPIMRRSFWEKLSAPTRSKIIDIWNMHVDKARLEAAIAQDQAKQAIVAKGIDIVVPKEDVLALWRENLVKKQDIFIREMSIDRGLAQQISDFF